MQTRIKACRKSMGITQKELSIKAGVSLDALRKWETNKRNISTRSAELLAEALSVNPAYLVGWIDHK